MGGVGGGGSVFIRVTYIGSLSVDQRVAHTMDVGPMMMMQQSGRCDLAGLPQHNQTQHLPVAQAPSYSHNHHAHASAKQQIQHYNNLQYCTGSYKGGHIASTNILNSRRNFPRRKL